MKYYQLKIKSFIYLHINMVHSYLKLFRLYLYEYIFHCLSKNLPRKLLTLYFKL